MKRVTAAELVKGLERESPEPGAALVFDADGTLWSGDVSEDVFLYAVRHRHIGEQAREALVAVAAEFRLDPSGSAAELAGRMLVAWAEGKLDELRLYELMTWCYAGHTPQALAALSRQTFAEVGLSRRLHRELLGPVIDWARERELRLLVVSASPEPIVVEAVALWGIPPEDVVASRAALSRGRLSPRMQGQVPYRAHKRVLAEGVLAGSQWLASFGDSPFDFEMLAAARVPVGVRPKPGLRARLTELPNSVVLE